MSKINTPDFSGEWVGQIANYPNKLKFEKTVDSDSWVGWVLKKPDEWVLMREVKYNKETNELSFNLNNGGRCECYASDYMLTGSYYLQIMSDNKSPLGFMLSRTKSPNACKLK